MPLRCSHPTTLDAAPGPLHPAARQTLLAAIDAGWADPRRLHHEGRRARGLLDQARAVLAEGLGVRPEEVSFHMGGGSAAVAAALDGLAWPQRRHARRIVASAVEHSSVLIPGRYAAAQADDPTLLEEVPVDRQGRIDLDAWAVAVARPGTAVAALQHANGEVGTIQPVEEAYAVCSPAGVPLLVDAMASGGRVGVPAAHDALVLDATSVAGPPLGVLVVPGRTRFGRGGPLREAEFGRADAPAWVPLALAAAEAWRQCAAVADEDAQAARELTRRIRAAAAALPDLEVAGDPDHRLPHVVTFSVLYAAGEAVVTELDRLGLGVASGSACTASTLEPSHVLAAMGVLTHGNVRVTLPWEAVMPERAAAVDALVDALPGVVAGLRPDQPLPDEPLPDQPLPDQQRPGRQRTHQPTAPGEGVGRDPVVVDARGRRCPIPIIRIAAAATDLPEGTHIDLLATDPATGADLSAWCRMRGHTLLGHIDLGHTDLGHTDLGDADVPEDGVTDPGASARRFRVRLGAGGG